MLVEFPNVLVNDKQQWPQIWNFGRIMRNACSHNSKIYFENNRAVPVSWKGLTYSPSDNGHPIFEDIGPADLIFLIIEMDIALGA